MVDVVRKYKNLDKLLGVMVALAHARNVEVAQAEAKVLWM